MAKKKQGSSDVASNLTLKNVAERRSIEVHMANYHMATKQVESGEEEASARANRIIAVENLMFLISRHCTGEIEGHSVASLDGLTNLPDADILTIARGMISLLEEEEKKSGASSAKSLRVVSA